MWRIAGSVPVNSTTVLTVAVSFFALAPVSSQAQSARERATPTQAVNPYDDRPNFYWTGSLGGQSTSTGFSTQGAASGSPLVDDPTTPNSSTTSGAGVVGGVGFEWQFIKDDNLPSPRIGFQTYEHFRLEGERFRVDGLFTQYAAEKGRSAVAGAFPGLPTKAPPKPRPPRITFGIDGNVYFFGGGNGTVSGIPGGPFGTATGTDSFKISNNYMLTLGGSINVPVSPSYNVALTGGFAELNQTVKYNCVTYCAVAPATPGFTASQDRWVAGGYVGGRVTMPVALPGFPGANFGIDYKHVFFGDYNVSLGSAATARVISARLSPDMDMATARLAIPIH